MKKIVLLSLMTLSSGLLGTEYPHGQQSADRISRPTRQQAQALRQEQDRTIQGPRSPRPITPTPVTITQAQGREFQAVTEQRADRAVAPRPRSLHLNTNGRMNDDDTPGAPRAQDDETIN